MSDLRDTVSACEQVANLRLRWGPRAAAVL